MNTKREMISLHVCLCSTYSALQKHVGCFNPVGLPQLQFKDQKQPSRFCVCTLQ